MSDNLRCAWMLCAKDALPHSLFCEQHSDGPLGLGLTFENWVLQFGLAVAPSVAASIIYDVLKHFVGATNLSHEQRDLIHELSDGKSLTKEDAPIILGNLSPSELDRSIRQVLAVSRQCADISVNDQSRLSRLGSLGGVGGMNFGYPGGVCDLGVEGAEAIGKRRKSGVNNAEDELLASGESD